MKATFEFNLPEEETDYKICVNSTKMYLALFEIFKTCRNEWKYNDKKTKKTVELAELIFAMIPEFVVEGQYDRHLCKMLKTF